MGCSGGPMIWPMNRPDAPAWSAKILLGGPHEIRISDPSLYCRSVLRADPISRHAVDPGTAHGTSFPETGPASHRRDHPTRATRHVPHANRFPVFEPHDPATRRRAQSLQLHSAATKIAD